MKKLLLCIPLLALVSCNKKNDISQFSWLSGRWQGENKGLVMIEAWDTIRGNTMSGANYGLRGNDTIYVEKMRLEQRGDDFYYVASVKENKGPVDFKFTGIDHDSLVFENPMHDFPQRIVYFHRSEKILDAYIEGHDDGAYFKTKYHFEKQ